MDRLQLWQRAAIIVKGLPDWIFIKLHCHGMDPRDSDALLRGPMQRFLGEFLREAASVGQVVHFTTVREMTNILLAACDGRDGNPDHFRDYRLRSIGTAQLRPAEPSSPRG